MLAPYMYVCTVVCKYVWIIIRIELFHAKKFFSVDFFLLAVWFSCFITFSLEKGGLVSRDCQTLLCRFGVYKWPPALLLLGQTLGFRIENFPKRISFPKVNLGSFHQALLFVEGNQPLPHRLFACRVLQITSIVWHERLVLF